MRHGKGDKLREVPLLGDVALEAPERWKVTQANVAGERQNVFCPLKKSRNILGGDRPMPDTDVYRVVKATEQRTGIVFAPHDARRTADGRARERGDHAALWVAILFAPCS